MYFVRGVVVVVVLVGAGAVEVSAGGVDDVVDDSESTSGRVENEGGQNQN
jgi:hypothetical protein